MLALDMTKLRPNPRPINSSLLSSMQYAYRVPKQSSNLKGNTTRYGCSVGIVRAACGVVPTLANRKPPLSSSYQTWYSSEFTPVSETVNSRVTKSSGEVKLPRIDTKSVYPELTRSKPQQRDRTVRVRSVS